MTTNFTLTDTDTLGMSATDSTASVVATAVNDAPTISGAASTSINDTQTATPFSTVTIADPDNQTGV